MPFPLASPRWVINGCRAYLLSVRPHINAGPGPRRSECRAEGVGAREALGRQAACCARTPIQSRSSAHDSVKVRPAESILVRQGQGLLEHSNSNPFRSPSAVEHSHTRWQDGPANRPGEGWGHPPKTRSLYKISEPLSRALSS